MEVDRKRGAVSAGLSLVGGSLVVAGVSMIFIPAALIIGGAGLTAAGLFLINVEARKQK